MAKKLYVGNLPFSINDQSLGDLFAQAGTVTSAKVIANPETGRSKGFGFVEMSTDEEAAQAIQKLNGSQVEGRPLTVNEARPMAPRGDRPPRGGGGGFRDRNRGGGGRGGFRGDRGDRGNRGDHG